MNRTKKLLKKATAVAAASALIVSGTSSVFANSYQDAEKAALSQFIANFSTYWDTVMKEQEKAMAGSKAVMTLKMEDGGKTLLSAASGGMDFSWLNTLTMDVTASIADGKEASNVAVLLNDAPLCNMNVYMGMDDMIEYMQVPELSETWLKVPLLASMELSEEELSASFETEEEIQDYKEYMEEYQASMNNYFEVLGDLTTVLPDTATLSTLIERYGNIVIDNSAEGTTAEETLSVEGISEDCTVYEEKITQGNFLNMMNAILTTAKDDQELKNLIDKWSELSEEDLYAQFQTSVGELLADVSEETVDADFEAIADIPFMASKIWTNAEGKIVGREISMLDDTGSYPLFTWKSPSADGNSALLLDIVAGESVVTFTGSGQSAEGLLNGDYVLAVNGVKTIGVRAENFETNPETPGYYNGNLIFSVLDKGTEEEPNPLAAFGLNLNIASDADNATSQMNFTVTNSGAALITLSVSGSYADTEVTVPEQAVLDSALDLTDGDSELTYIQGMDWSTLLANASAAGVPEELVMTLDQIFQQSVESALNPTEGEEGTETELDTEESAA